MALKPTKIKNSSQSGKKNIADELNEVIETQLPTVEETKAELQPVVRKTLIEALTEEVNSSSPDELEAADEFANNKAADFEYSIVNEDYDDVRYPGDKPVLSIAGKKIELLELPAGKTPFINHSRYHDGDDLIVTSTDPRSSLGNYSRSRIPTDKKIKWFTATVNDITFNLSSGSQVQIKEGIDGYGWVHDDYQAVSQGPVKRELNVIASKIECNHLSIEGKCVINNSVLMAQHYIHIQGCIVSCSNIHSDYNIDIKSSRVSQSGIYGANYVNINDKSHIDGAYISGLGRITISDSRTTDGFKISLHARHGVLQPALDIKGVLVSRFDSFFGDMEKATKVYQENENRYSDMILRIERRIDYGVFSGITEMPFIRVGDHSMLIGGELFTSEEFFGKACQDTQPKPVDPTLYRSEETSFRPNFGVGVLGGGSYYKGSLVWNRAAKVLYGYKHRNLVVGKSGEAMVNTLVEQIKSRLGLYVEINNMGL